MGILVVAAFKFLYCTRGFVEKNILIESERRYVRQYGRRLGDERVAEELLSREPPTRLPLQAGSYEAP